MTKRSTEAWKVIHEEISEKNVLRMSELIALQETKFLIGYMGTPVIEIRKKLCVDIAHKKDYKYVLSNSYDLVQEIALFLCENMGRKLFDTYRVDKKGKAITIQMQAQYVMDKLVSYKIRHMKTDCSLEELTDSQMPTTEIQEETTAEKYDVVDRIIASLNLNETQHKVLQYRMNGMSYPQIARELCRATSTIYECLQKVQKKYLALHS